MTSDVIRQDLLTGFPVVDGIWG